MSNRKVICETSILLLILQGCL